MSRFWMRGLVAAVLSALVAVPAVARSQTPNQTVPPTARPESPRDSELTRPDDAPAPGEVHRLFDAYAVMQAQEVLQLRDDQLAPFVKRLRALHDVRRRNTRVRALIIGELQRTFKQTPHAIDDSYLRRKLDELEKQDVTAAMEIRAAHAAVDELLDVRQRARFRVLEDQLEKKKLELLSRVRQSIRQNRQRPPS